MITAYHRPQSLAEAQTLLARQQPPTVPLGGGTFLAHSQLASLEVVDLQALGLDKIGAHGKDLEIGATATLQSLLETAQTPPALKQGLKLEAPLNIRNLATVAGTLVMADGRSAFATGMLALDARLTILANGKSRKGSQVMGLGDFLPLRPRGLITMISIPLQARLAFEYVARTHADKPLVCVALARWPSGRTRVAVGGQGAAPRLAMDGTGTEGLEAAVRNALHEASDPSASAEYRMDAGATLVKRCLAGIGSNP